MDNFDLDRIRLIVGLGNKGEEYANTRHNAGFLFLDFLANFFNTQFRPDKKLFSEIAESNKLLLVKPTTMMNYSGRCVYTVMRYCNISLDKLILVHDDLDIRLGFYKIQFARGPKIHNGLRSVESFINSKNFWRIRLGIDNRDKELRKKINGSDYVLSNFHNYEIELLNQVFEKLSKDLQIGF